MMPAGARNRRIRIERSVPTVNTLNEQVPNWLLLARVWAEKLDVSDSERVRSAEVSAEITSRFRIKWSSLVEDVNPRDRVVYNNQVYNIVGVKEIGNRDGVEISAEARADQATV
jgi:SPP1 family predicted phage head-tail adaptor